YQRIRRQFFADRRRIRSGDDIQNTFGNTSTNGKFCKSERRERRILRRLHNSSASHRERGTDFPCNHRIGKIPRRDRRNDTDWLFQNNRTRPCLEGRQRLAVNALGLLGEEFDKARTVHYLTARLTQWLSLLFGK